MLSCCSCWFMLHRYSCLLKVVHHVRGPLLIVVMLPCCHAGFMRCSCCSIVENRLS
jgi:hypothetical protein